jgi:hypothetical protein
MKTNERLSCGVSIDRHGQLRRRDFFRAVSLASAAAGTLSFTDTMLLHADDLRQRGMACILLWMQGGPSQFETFSPKSGSTGGEVKAISTAVSGIEISENLPNTAQVMNDICLVRSMTSNEGSHPRATFLLHTGYIPNASVKYPTLGSIVAHQIGDRAAELPSFVSIGNRGRGGAGSGFLGVDYAPFSLASARRSPENTKPATSESRYERRLQFLAELENDYAASGGEKVVADHRKLYDKAAKMILSPQMEAFDIAREPSSVRTAYGEGEFAAGCLLARRLVEAGVTFVEVTLGNWDTHDNNAERSKQLCDQLDQPYAELLRDLKQRGLLDKTLVIWMGEFGRTPRINPRGGRDHYPRAFDAALAGGGIRGGQVIGRTDASGATVRERPVGVQDLFRTICHSLKINADHENISGIGRPIRIVDGGKPVLEAFTG